MPTYTILGATGKTGGALLTLLLTAPDTNIKLYVRSKAKLLRQEPGLNENKRVEIFEGALSDIALLADALSPQVDAAFSVLAVSENIPDTRIAQDAAQSIVAALCYVRNSNPGQKPPRLIFLSSSSINPRLYESQPAIVHAVAGRAFAHIYRDLALAEQYLRLHRSWLHATFIQPGGLVKDVQRGHKLSLSSTSPMVSYLDLAAGMIEIAESGDYDWKGVSVEALGNDVRFEWDAPGQIARGLVWHFAPSLYGVCRYLNIVSG